MYQYIVCGNNAFLKNGYILTPSKLTKLFDGDILNQNHKLISSPIREQELVGFFSTSQTTRYGKNKSGNTIYSVTPFRRNLPNFLISFGKRLKGRIVIRFKFVNWNKKLPIGRMVDTIGNLEESNLLKTLQYHYQIYPNYIKYDVKINKLESNIIRRDLTYLNLFSIDPSGCKDIDDAMSLESINDIDYIGIHIAQPIYWLNQGMIEKTSKKKFSTLYLGDRQKNLWTDEITELASLTQGEKKPVYSIIFAIKNNKVIDVKHCSSFVINKNVLTYDNAILNPNVEQLFNITNKIKKIKDTHELVSFWMIQVNQFIGKQINHILPLRVNKINNSQLPDLIPEQIKQVFQYRGAEGASYSMVETTHQSLNLTNYTHFTSPIRRIIDTIIHYYITYNVIIDIDLNRLNYLDKQTKRFHRCLELLKIIDSLPKESENVGYIYRFIRPNLFEIYVEEIGFVKMELFNSKFMYQYQFRYEDDKIHIFNENEDYVYQIGQKVNVIILKKKAFFPRDKLVILLN